MSSELSDRNMKAMGNAMNAAFQACSADEKKEFFQSGLSQFDDIDEQQDAISNQFNEDEKRLLNELISLLDIENRKKGQEGQQQVQRARDIIEKLELNVNFKAMPYGGTFLSSAIDHGIDMVKLFLEKGADVNNEDTMDSATALDHILESEEFNDDMPLDEEMTLIKTLLLSKGAKTYEERMNQLADKIRTKSG